MNKTIKETLVMLISLANITIGVLGISFCFENMLIYAIITVISFILIQPLYWNAINKLSEDQQTNM